MFGKLKSFLSSCRFAYRSLSDFTWKWIRLGLKTYLLSILLLSLFLLLSLIPLFTANICSKATQSCALCLLSHLFEIFMSVWFELCRGGRLISLRTLSFHFTCSAQAAEAWLGAHLRSGQLRLLLIIMDTAVTTANLRDLSC